MKVLILSCNTGGGHNSAALAARDAFIQAAMKRSLSICFPLPVKNYPGE